MTQKIRLCSMIGESSDSLQHFINHYKKLGVSDFHFIVHAKDYNDSFYKEVKEILVANNIKDEILYSGVWNGLICTNLINDIKNQYPGDWFIVADQDEFQLYPKSLSDIINDCEKNSVEFVTGCFLDRLSSNGELNEISQKTSIWEQFPLCSFVSFPLNKANPYKITLMKGGIELSEGQHGVLGPEKPYPYTNNIICQVHHFKWTKNLRSRFRQRLEDFKNGKWKNSYSGYATEVERMLSYIDYNKGINIYEPLFLVSLANDKFTDYFFWQKILEITKSWRVLQSYPIINIANPTNQNSKYAVSERDIFDVSAIISSYNQSHLIVESIKVLVNEAMFEEMRIQIIIADDGSKSQDCLNIIENISLYNNLNNIAINFVTQQDLGFRLAESRNNGLRIAKSNNIIFIDGDCIPVYGIITSHLKVIEKNTISVGAREYRPPLRGTLTDYNLYQEYYMKGRIESSTIRNKSKTSTPWRAVIGRNFAFKIKNKTTLFDENIVGWGFEDTDFAIQLYNKGLDVEFNEMAKVVEYGSPQDSSSPFLQTTQENIINTQINALALMNKYKKYNDIYLELSKYLAYYSDAFIFENGTFVFNETHYKDTMEKFSSENTTANLEESYKKYTEVLHKIKIFYQYNTDCVQHPYFKRI